jgi:hypothetical protein
MITSWYNEPKNDIELVDLARGQVRFRRFSTPSIPKKARIISPFIEEKVVLPPLPPAFPPLAVPDITLSVLDSAWTPVFTIPQGSVLLKGRPGLYHEITGAADAVSDRCGCYSWGSPEAIFYCGSFARDDLGGRFKSNLQARVHNYLQNHRTKHTGQKNTNLMVFENINEALGEYRYQPQDFHLRSNPIRRLRNQLFPI